MNPDDLLKPYDLSPSGVREVQRNPATGAEKRLADATLGLLAQLCTLPSLLRGVVARDDLPHAATSEEALASAIATLRASGARRLRLEWLDANDQVIRTATPEEDQAHLVVYQTAVARAHEGLDLLDAFEQLTQAHDADAKELTRLRMRVADLQGAQDALDAAREEARCWNARATELDAERATVRDEAIRLALDVCAAHATTYADSANGWPHNTYETHQAAAEEIAQELRARAGAVGLSPTHDPSVETRARTLPWGPVPTPDVIEAHAKAHPYVLNRECGDHECTDSACEVVPVGAWLVRTRHTNGTANLWHVTAWVHPDHGGGARCATLAWPDAMERLPEEFGRGVLKDVVETQWVALDGHGDPPAGASPAPKAPKLTGAEFLERASQAFPAIVNATDEEIEAAFGPGALGYSPEPAPATPVAATDADASAVVQAMQALVPLASQAYRHDVGGLEPVEAPVMLAHAGDREAGPELVLACSLAQDNPAPWTGYVVYDGPEGVEVVCAGIASPNALEALDELRVELDAACTPAPIRWGDVGTMEHDVDPDENDEG